MCGFLDEPVAAGHRGETFRQQRADAEADHSVSARLRRFGRWWRGRDHMRSRAWGLSLLESRRVEISALHLAADAGDDAVAEC
jgi:hypothetical protein